MVVICTTSMGLIVCNNKKRQVDICQQLVSLCDFILIDYESKLTPIIELVDELLSYDSLKKLNFITTENLIMNSQIDSCLSREENEKLSSFLYSLGKTDVNAQIQIIKSFREYIKRSEYDYLENYNKYKKLYLSIGFLSGVCVCIIFA